MNVFIIEATYSEDFYGKQLDGFVAKELLTMLGISNTLRMVRDEYHFKKALKEANALNATIVHLSCHGDKNKLAIGDNYTPCWKQFADLFQKQKQILSMLVMSACCGASTGIGKGFAESKKWKPDMIFGSKDERTPNDYVLAWSILYYRLATDGVKNFSVRNALKQIHTVVSDTFLYRQWNDEENKYKIYPSKKRQYAIEDKNLSLST